MSRAGGQCRLSFGHVVLRGCDARPGGLPAILGVDFLFLVAVFLLLAAVFLFVLAVFLFLAAVKASGCGLVGGVARGLGFLGCCTAVLGGCGWQRLRYSS